MLKLIAVVVFSLLYDVQVVVSTSKRSPHEALQDVEKPVSPVVYQGRGADAQEEPRVVESDARWNPPLDALP